MERPKVGVGVIIENSKGEILVGKRKGSVAQYYSVPGGHLEIGETFEDAAIKEVLEETGLQINNPKVICVTNNMRTYRSEGAHFISVTLHTKDYSGVAKVMEPDKCEDWLWVKPTELPQPHFDASEFGVECMLAKRFYIKEQNHR